MALPPGRAFKLAMKHPVVKGVVKYAVKKSCEPTMDAIFSTRDISETDKKEVVDLICRSLDAVVDYTLEQKFERADVVKAGIYIMQAGVTARNLSHAQQEFCSKAIVDFAVNGADYMMEGFDTAKDIVEFSEIGEMLEPAGGGLVGGATALSLHAADFYKKAGAVANAAYDVHSQCGDLSLDKAPKTRQPEVSPTALACYPTDDDSGPPAEINMTRP